MVGLTATPIRRDGHQTIIFMQCGPIRHSAASPETAPAQLKVWPKVLSAPEIPPDSPIQDVFCILVGDSARNRSITEDVLTAYPEGRKVLVLTERTEHLPLLREALGARSNTALSSMAAYRKSSECGSLPSLMRWRNPRPGCCSPPAV